MTVTSPAFEDVAVPRPPRSVGIAAVAVLASVVVWIGSLDADPNPLFHPHGYCYLWQPSLVAAHVSSDLAIGAAYVVISLTLAYLVFRARRQIPFGWMFLAFGLFIVACGATHFTEVITLWKPWFWTSAGVKILTAVASVGTAFLLPPLVPRALQLLASAQVSEVRRLELEEAKRELESRVHARTIELQAALAREHELRQQAETANRVKDEFLGLISHELRTPLNAMLGWSSVLAQRELPREAYMRGVAAINRNAQIQAKLIDDLLDTSRVIAGKLRIAHEPLAIGRVISEVVDSTRPLADAKGVRVVYTDAAPEALIVGDSQRVQQIVWNLLSNAVKFTPRDGHVEVVVSHTAARVSVTVRDSGVGIDKAFLPRLFERFSQADSSPSRTHTGLGLGLALVRHLVELHGGEVSADSDGPGHGATFTASFPLFAFQSASSAETHGGPMAPDLRDVRVLVVDDDQEALDMLSVGLAGFGAIVITARSAAEATLMVQTDTPDVLVSDLAMPGDDGIALLHTLREQGILVPAIALTAHVRPEDRSRVLTSGFCDCIAKPATPLEVAGAIQLARN